MMKKVQKISIVFIAVLTLMSCAKERSFSADFSSSVTEDANGDITIETSVTSSQAIELRGLLLSLDTNLTFDNEPNYYYYYTGVSSRKIVDDYTGANKTYTFQDLKPSAIYYYRLFAIYTGVVQYSEIQQFETACGGLGCGPAGGQIIYLDNTGEHGIEVAANYVTPNTFWGCSGFAIGGTVDDVGSGQANTNLILDDCGTNTLAWYCDNYEQNGFADYYMPSIDELELIYTEVFKAHLDPNSPIVNPYNWDPVEYFSSTESSTSLCKTWNFSYGGSNSFSKSSTNYRTIPVRTF